MSKTTSIRRNFQKNNTNVTFSYTIVKEKVFRTIQQGHVPLCMTTNVRCDVLGVDKWSIRGDMQMSIVNLRLW